MKKLRILIFMLVIGASTTGKSQSYRKTDSGIKTVVNSIGVGSEVGDITMECYRPEEVTGVRFASITCTIILMEQFKKSFNQKKG